MESPFQPKMMSFRPFIYFGPFAGKIKRFSGHYIEPSSLCHT
jgi:hypothetical protein